MMYSFKLYQVAMVIMIRVWAAGPAQGRPGAGQTSFYHGSSLVNLNLVITGRDLRLVNLNRSRATLAFKLRHVT